MTEDLSIKALQKAIINRPKQDNIIFHSDRGSQYIINNFEGLLSKSNIRYSYSKKGYHYDNASMEIFNALLTKDELKNIIVMKKLN